MTDSEICVKCGGLAEGKTYIIGQGAICLNCYQKQIDEANAKSVGFIPAPKPTPQQELTTQPEQFVFIKNEESKSTMEFICNRKNGYEFDISESAQYEAQNVICMTNKFGKKLFFRKGKRTPLGTELSLLSAEELSELHIEESTNSELFDVSIEESTENGEKKPIKQFNSDSIEDMKMAMEQAKRRIQELGGSTEEIEDSEKEIIDNLKEKLSLQLASKGVDVDPSEIKGQADIERWISVIKTIESKLPTPSGSAPLSDGQIYGHSQNEGFSSMEEMIDSVRDKASPQNPNKIEREQNQAILNKLTEKWAKGLRSQPHQEEYSEDVPLVERLNETYRRRRKLAHKIIEVE